MVATLRDHWPEYLMEATGLGLFMVSAGVVGTVLEYPGSAVRVVVTDPVARRMIGAIAMGLTAVAIIYSPWGKRSGAHINPAVTLTFWRLGKVGGWDVAFYVVAQFVGALLGVLVVAAAFGTAFATPPVQFAATLPLAGNSAAWVAELVISALLMFTVLTLTNVERLARYTGLAVGGLVATYIAFESPVSGMSINPARTFASALPAHLWTGLWVYFTAPPLGMLLAAEVYRVVRRGHGSRVRCAKLHHQNDARCIFRCGYRAAQSTVLTSSGWNDVEMRSPA